MDYNEIRPHSALGNATPAAFASALEEEGYPSSSTGQASACLLP